MYNDEEVTFDKDTVTGMVNDELYSALINLDGAAQGGTDANIVLAHYITVYETYAELGGTPDPTWDVGAQKILCGINPDQLWPDDKRKSPYLVVEDSPHNPIPVIVYKHDNIEDAKSMVSQSYMLNNSRNVRVLLIDEFDKLKETAEDWHDNTRMGI